MTWHFLPFPAPWPASPDTFRRNSSPSFQPASERAEPKRRLSERCKPCRQGLLTGRRQTQILFEFEI